MTDYLNVYDLNLKKVAILENSTNVIGTTELNNMSYLSFDMPSDDGKKAYCNPFWFVRNGDHGPFYRFTTDVKENEEVGTSTYECEHAATTLIDDLIWGTWTLTGLQTRVVLLNLIGRQTIKRWDVGKIELDATYDYSWSYETLLNAIFSVATPWTSPYKWTYDFTTYPWKINLLKIDPEKGVEFYIRAKKNLLDSTERVTNTDICTRLYALGYGEGINQLTIKDVNNNVPYLQSPASYVNKYGIISRVYVDRSIEDASLLKSMAEAVLTNLQEPAFTKTFNLADLEPLTNDPLDHAEVGKVVKLVGDGTITYITKVIKSLDSDIGTFQIELSTKSTDIANEVANLANRQRIESTYSQGSTQLYLHSINENATSASGAKISIYIPDEMKVINAVKAKIELRRYRAYTKQTASKSAEVKTSSSNGASTNTSSTQGEATATVNTVAPSALTTESGGANTGSTGAVWTDDSNTVLVASVNHKIVMNAGKLGSNSGGPYNFVANPSGHYHYTNIPASQTVIDDWSHNHYFTKKDIVHNHRVEIPYHDHLFNIPAHTHTVKVPSHSHSVSIGNHDHTITIPEHNHEIQQGIFEYGNPSSANVLFDGVQRLSMSKSGEFDITQYFVDSSGKIPRGRWFTIEVRPNDLAYININVYVQGFIQSRGGGTY